MNVNHLTRPYDTDDPTPVLKGDQRAAIERCIDALITLLDVSDPDPDLEPNADLEPYLAASSGPHWHANGPGENLELDPAYQDAPLMIAGGNEMTADEATWRLGDAR